MEHRISDNAPVFGLFTCTCGERFDSAQSRDSHVDTHRMISASSLGSEAAKAAIDSVPPEHGRRLVAEAARREWLQAHCMCATPDWYHDGLESDSDGRLCRRCRKRQNIPYRDLVQQVSWNSPAEIPGDVDAVLDCEGDSWRRDKYDPSQEGIPRTWEWLDEEDGRWRYSASMHRFAPFVAGGAGS